MLKQNKKSQRFGKTKTFRLPRASRLEGKVARIGIKAVRKKPKN